MVDTLWTWWCYIGDLLVYSWESENEHSDRVLNASKEPKEVFVLQEFSDFLHQVASEQRVHPDLNHIPKILKLPTHTSIRELQLFLGFVNQVGISRSLIVAELRWWSIELEVQGVAWACSRFGMYIFGTPDVTIETDHKPIVPICTSKAVNALTAKIRR